MYCPLPDTLGTEEGTFHSSWDKKPKLRLPQGNGPIFTLNEEHLGKSDFFFPPKFIVPILPLVMIENGFWTSGLGPRTQGPLNLC